MSTIIPTSDYASILGGQLGIALNTSTNETLPLFLIDSGDLGLLTNPLALISQVKDDYLYMSIRKSHVTLTSDLYLFLLLL